MDQPVAFFQAGVENKSLLQCAGTLLVAPSLARHVSSVHFDALNSAHARVRQVSDYDLGALATSAPSLRSATLAALLSATPGQPLRPPAFLNLTSLTLVAASSTTLSRPDASFLFLFLSNAPRLTALRVSYAQTGLTHFAASSQPTSLPFRLRTYVVEPLFDGFEQPLLCSRGTLRSLSVRFFPDVYERQRALVSALHHSGGTLREL
ncbi:hypothetical protein AURDEDRAFT_166256, partial [Auricularia subglabra TFB-10046 SS5]